MRPRNDDARIRILNLLGSGAARTSQIADALEMTHDNTHIYMLDLEKAGHVVRCKVDVPGRISQNEWRLAGIAMPDTFRPLNGYNPNQHPGRPGEDADRGSPHVGAPSGANDNIAAEAAPTIEVSEIAVEHIEAAPPPAPSANPAEIVIPKFLLLPSEEPARGNGQRAIISRARTFTEHRTGELSIMIDDQARLHLQIVDGASDPLILSAEETLAVGDFLALTERLWRP